MTVLLVHAERNDDTIEPALGTAEYSYYFVLKAFLPVLETLGLVIRVVDTTGELDSDGHGTRVYTTVGEVEAVYALCRRVGEPCLFLSFSPPHRTEVALSCPTVPVFAWEFHDLPNEVWDGEPRNDWCAVLRQLGRAITHSQFAVSVVRKALGKDYPITSIPAPVWDRFAPLYDAGGNGPDLGARELDAVNANLWDGFGLGLDLVDGEVLGASTGFELDVELATTDASPTKEGPHRGLSADASTPIARAVSLTGVVYTTVLSPYDGRKNWQQILRAFCITLGDREDATLIIKLIGDLPGSRRVIWTELERLQPFRCKVVAIYGFLDDKTYEQLAQVSTYAVNASSGEGQCLPLMEYMSAGRPAIAPHHTAMLDYLATDNAFLVETSLEPAAWPQDTRRRYRTRSHRLNLESLMQAFRESYRVARDDPERYASMSRRAHEQLQRHCSTAAVRAKLKEFLAAELAVRASGD